MNKTGIILIVCFFVLAGTFAGGFFTGKAYTEKQYSPVNQTVTIDTSKVHQSATATVAPTFSASTKPAYVYYHANVDSIYAEAKAYWEAKLKDSLHQVSPNLNDYCYNATGDTVFHFSDSKGMFSGDIHVKALFNSPLPLHPASKFIISEETDFVSLQKTITNQVVHETVKLPSILIGAGYSFSYENDIFQKDPFVSLSYNTKILFMHWTNNVLSRIRFENGNIKLIPQLQTSLSIAI
jgi:hypothetical protein